MKENLVVDILILVAGLVLIVLGGNYVTDGSTAVARRFRVSNLVIGLTVVAFGSSAPDLVVCLTSTIAGKSELALGDVVGANIFDVLLVIGVVAMIKPIEISPSMLRTDLPMLALSSLALFFCGDDILFDGAPANIINRTDGLMLLAFFAIFMAYTFATVRQPECSPGHLRPATGGRKYTAPSSSAKVPAVSAKAMWIAAVSIVGGLGALVLGGNWIVRGASGIALRCGLSEGMVGLTIVAIGSSIPDLATSVIAAVKHQPGIAVGNVVGSCVFNVFFILGVCSTVRPLNAGTISLVDFSTLAAGSLLLWFFARYIGHLVIKRAEAAVLILAYVAYTAYVIVSAIS